MSVQVAHEHETDPGVATLLGGIAHDARVLLTEQLNLFQVELKNEFHRGFNSLIPIFIGVGAGIVGLVLTGIGLAYLLFWAVPNLHVWGAFLIVGLVTVGIGAVLFYVGSTMLASTKLVPETAIKELKENINVLADRKDGM